jgi:hypothetical protein
MPKRNLPVRRVPNHLDAPARHVLRGLPMIRAIIMFAAKVQVHWQFNRWILRTTLRAATGRLYVFRDAPLWFVQVIAGNPPAKHEKQQLHDYHAEAVAELDRRILTAARTGEPIRTEQ